MSPAAVNVRSPMSSSQTQPTQNPNLNPSFNFDFSSSNSVCQSSFSRLLDHHNGGFGVGGVAKQTKPRFAKVRRRSSSQQSRSTKTSVSSSTSELGFNPFKPVSVSSSDFVHDANSGSNFRTSNCNAISGVFDKFGKFENVGFVFGASRSASEVNSDSGKREFHDKKESLDSGGKDEVKIGIQEDIEKFKNTIKFETRKIDNEGFVFGAIRTNSPAVNLSSKIGESTAKSVTSGIAFTDTHSASFLNLNLEKETTNGNVESDYRKQSGKGVSTKFPKENGNTFGLGHNSNNGVFIFGQSSGKSSSCDESMRTGETENKKTCSSSTMPDVGLADDMTKLHIRDFENVGLFNVKESNNCHSLKFESGSVSGSNKMTYDFSTENSARTSVNLTKSLNSDCHGSGVAIGKTDEADLEAPENGISVFASAKSDVFSFSGWHEHKIPEKSTNIGIVVGDNKKETDSSCSFFQTPTIQKQPPDLESEIFKDHSPNISIPPHIALHEGARKHFEGDKFVQAPADHIAVLNNNSVASAFATAGVDLQTSSDPTNNGGDKSESCFSFTSEKLGNPFTDSRLHASSLFTSLDFSALSQKCGMSKSMKDKRSKNKKGKQRQATLSHQLRRPKSQSREDNSQEALHSPECGSPMDFSPYVDAEQHSRESSLAFNESSHPDSSCAPPNVRSLFSTEIKDGGLATERDMFDIKTDGSQGVKLNNGGSVNNKYNSFFTSLNHAKPGGKAETKCFNSRTTQACSTSGCCVASTEPRADLGFKMGEQENGTLQFPFVSSSNGSNFIFNASSFAQGGPQPAKVKHKKKQKVKVGRNNPNTLHLEANPPSSSVLSSPPTSTSTCNDAKQCQKEDFPIAQSKITDKPKAEEQTKQSLSASGTSEEACEKLRVRGNQAYKSGDLSKAEDFYTRGINCISKSKKNGRCLEPVVMCYSNRAATRMRLGRIREALADCLMAIKLDPNFLKVQNRAANCHLMMGEVEDAEKYFRRCLESGTDVCLDRRITIEASDGLQKAKKVTALMTRSAELLQERTCIAAASALELITEALSLCLYSEKLLEMKATALFVLRKYDEVIRLCEQTLNFAEKNFSSDMTDDQSGGTKGKEGSFISSWRLQLISRCYFHLGRLDLALDMLEKQEQAGSISKKCQSTISEPSISFAVTIRELLRLKNAGNEAFKSGRYEEAVECYSAALLANVESRPFVAICFCNRAAAYQALGQIADAIADCSIAIALDGNYQKAISRRASLYEKIRDFGQAVADLQKLVSLLEGQSHRRADNSGSSDRPTNTGKELRQARKRLSLMDEEAKKEKSLDMYLILGVKRSDVASDIKKAYRKAALRHHPDKAGQYLARSEGGNDGQLWKEIAEVVYKDADRLFKMIGEAYAVLSDPTKRSDYDLEEELRIQPKDIRRHTGRPSDVYSHPFKRDTEQYCRERWKTYGSSYYSRW
ncbi:DnaJ domain [Dillenia turbinata]|uniref:DnaJ domain n=1 Tax=Dillenia turbinata TaxID=194707 RepID=A0AAN8ZHW9_9MAGN